MNALRVKAPVAAARLSSRTHTTCSPVLPKAASAPGMTRLVSLVCEAQQGSKSAAAKAMQAVREVEVPAAMKPVLAATVSNLLIAAPSHAGVLFDFNLTLPIIAGQFLALMFVLDKLIYTPVGEVLDKRDGELRSKLAAVKDNSTELNALAAEAEGYLAAARNDAAAAINKSKNETEKECAEKVAAAKSKMDKELKVAMDQLMASKEESMKGLDKSVKELSDLVVAKVLPA